MKDLKQQAVIAKVETNNEMSESEILNAYLSNHAVEHYCAALHADANATESILQVCAKEDGVYWLYTQPAIGGKRSDGKDNPTREEWESLNPAAVYVDTLAGKLWYKRPFVIGDARGVRSIVNGYNNYNDAVAGAQRKVDNLLAATAAIYGLSIEELKAKLGK